MPKTASQRGRTLEQRVEQGVAKHQFYFDPPGSYDMHIHCSWCEDSLLVDYFQFPYPEMSRRLIQWVKQHEGCEPALQTKDKDMQLTPKEHAS